MIFTDACHIDTSYRESGYNSRLQFLGQVEIRSPFTSSSSNVLKILRAMFECKFTFEKH